MTQKKELNSYDLKALEALLVELKYPKFRAKQIFGWLHEKQVKSFEEMTNLPKEMIGRLKEDFMMTPIKLIEKFDSKKGETSKFLFELYDGQAIETVWMTYEHGNSLCITSQAGCRMGCTFCASTIGGLVRQLSAGEMLAQIYEAERIMEKKITSLVVMGTGEPFDNYEELVKFINIIIAPEGRNLGQRHITVSTCGLVDKIYEFIELDSQVNLAVSLHATNDELRSSMMPINNKYPIAEVLKACKDYTTQTHRRITFEYSMVKGVNDSLEEAKVLCRLLKGMLCHVNLIPVNGVKERSFKATETSQIQKFKQVLEQFHIPVTIRRSLGEDINAACGQLRRTHIEKQEFDN